MRLCLAIFLISGVSLFVYLATSWEAANSFLMKSFSTLLIFLSFPHFMATYLVWWKRKKQISKEWWPILFPILYAGLFYLSYKFPENFMSSELIIKLSYIYLLYHFALQLFGSHLWLFLKTGTQVIKTEKYFLKLFVLLCALYSFLELEMKGGGDILFYAEAATFNAPTWIIESVFLMVLFLLFALVFLSWYKFHKTKKLNSFFPLLLPLTCGLWFIPPFASRLLLYLPLLHALQYAPFLSLKLNDQSPWKLLLSYGVCIFSGWFLFRWVPVQMNFSGGLGPLWPAFVLTLLNNHHFIIDGRIWKLSDQQNSDLFRQKPGK